MAKLISDPEFINVSALPGPGRYSHFIFQVADWAEVWGLRGADGWVLAADDEGHPLMPVWPHERYAAACATGDWSNTVPEAISLERWLVAWAPGLARDGRRVAVFPLPAGAGVAVDAERLAADLSAACEQIE